MTKLNFKIDSLITYTIDEMNKLIDIYTEILDVAKQKQEYIVLSDTEGLNECVRKERILLKPAETAAQCRQDAVNALACALGKKELNTQDILEACNSEMGAAFKHVWRELSRVLREVAKINESNQSLLDIQLSCVNMMLGAYMHDSQLNNIYGDTGNAEDNLTSSIGIFDSKV